MLRHVIVIVVAIFVAGCAASSSSTNRTDGGAALDGAVAPPDDFAAAPPDDGGLPPPGDLAGAAGMHVTGTFTNTQGSRDWRAYIPSGYVAGHAIPLVVFLHGCGESLDHAEAATRLTTLAEARTFIVVYPAQSLTANSAACWNWFLAADQARDTGEPSLIAGITRDLMSRYSVDAKRVFVLGPSAGGAMTVVMGATYPDLYAAMGVFFGCEFNGLPCGSSGGPDPATEGQSAYQTMGAHARVVPLILFHGDADTIAAPVNGQQVAAQWIATDDYADNGALDGTVAATPSAHDTGQVPGGESWDRDRYTRSDGSLLLERWVVHGMGHAWPGGDATQTFADANAPDGTTIGYEFFMAHPMP